LIESELSTLRGAVRDGVSAIENLANVLASRRVGPKVIARALPEVSAGCSALRSDLRHLRAELPSLLAAQPDGIAGADEMLERADHRVADLAGELARKEASSMDARDRLALEAIVRRSAGELSGVVRLLDLFAVVLNPRATGLDIAELIMPKHTLTGAGSVTVPVTVDLTDVGVLVADARLVINLLSFALASVVGGGVTAPALVARREDRETAIEIGPPGPEASAADKRFIEVPVWTPLPREADVVRVVARLGGIEVRCDHEAQRVVLAHARAERAQ
jgi:hypothetical protein